MTEIGPYPSRVPSSSTREMIYSIRVAGCLKKLKLIDQVDQKYEWTKKYEGIHIQATQVVSWNNFYRQECTNFQHGVNNKNKGLPKWTLL